jgi:hypothetical protein
VGAVNPERMVCGIASSELSREAWGLWVSAGFGLPMMVDHGPFMVRERVRVGPGLVDRHDWLDSVGTWSRFHYVDGYAGRRGMLVLGEVAADPRLDSLVSQVQSALPRGGYGLSIKGKVIGDPNLLRTVSSAWFTEISLTTKPDDSEAPVLAVGPAAEALFNSVVELSP